MRRLGPDSIPTKTLRRIGAGEADPRKLRDVLDLPKDKPLETIRSFRSHNCSLTIVETEASLRANN